MTKQRHYLIVWGSSVHAVRGGDGMNEADAAKDAFGQHDPKRMTFKPVSLAEIRSDKKRLAIIRQLLLDHAARMNDDAIRAAVDKQLAGLPSLFSPRVAR